MINMRTIKDVLWGSSPRFKSLRSSSEDELCDDGLTMGTLYIGKQGTGKTTSLARHLVNYYKRYPNRAIFVLDWSGSITDSILTILLKEGDDFKRVIYDQLGNTDLVVPMPEFSLAYGTSYEEEVQRVTSNLSKLSPYLIQNAPVLGGVAVREIGPHFFRLLTAITNDDVDSRECWQITETKKLMMDRNLLRKQLSKFGHKIPDTGWFLNSEYLNNEMKSSEREMRTYALRALLNITDIRELRARLGYYTPGWTANEAIAKGQLVIVDGAKLIGQEQSQHYLFTQVFSLIMEAIKRRRPADPNDKPVSLVLDEVASLIKVPGMAIDLSQLSPQYRSRKLQLYIVLQELAQMDKELGEHIWSLGNIVSFAISNFNEAYEIAQQLFAYDPKQQKLPPVTDKHQPMIETDRGQYLEVANWIQRLVKRECIIRRYISESQMDRNILHVKQTIDTPTVANISYSALNDLKDELLKKRAIPVRDAIEHINKRLLVEPSGRPVVEL